MTRKEVNALFTLSGFDIIRMKPLPSGYMSYDPDDERYLETLPGTAWWFVKTQYGWIEIGPRKRVYNIDWEDTPLRKIITNDDTTKHEHYIHAWTQEKVLEYLKALKKELDAKISA